MAGVPLLVYANKQDLVGALSADEIAEQLNLFRWVQHHNYTFRPDHKAEGDDFLLLVILIVIPDQKMLSISHPCHQPPSPVRSIS